MPLLARTGNNVARINGSLVQISHQFYQASDVQVNDGRMHVKEKVETFDFCKPREIWGCEERFVVLDDKGSVYISYPSRELNTRYSDDSARSPRPSSKQITPWCFQSNYQKRQTRKKASHDTENLTRMNLLYLQDPSVTFADVYPDGSSSVCDGSFEDEFVFRMQTRWFMASFHTFQSSLNGMSRRVKIKLVGCGFEHLVLVSEEDELYGHGSNDCGQLGLPKLIQDVAVGCEDEASRVQMTKITHTSEFNAHVYGDQYYLPQAKPKRRIIKIGAGTAHTAFLTSAIEGEMGGQIFATGHMEVCGVADNNQHCFSFKPWTMGWIIGQEEDDQKPRNQPTCSCSYCAAVVQQMLTQDLVLDEWAIGQFQFDGLAVNSNSITATCVDMGTSSRIISTEKQTNKPVLNLILSTSISETTSIAQDRNAMIRPMIFSSNYSLCCAMPGASEISQNDPIILEITASGSEESFHMMVLIADMVPRMREYFRDLPQYVNGQVTKYEQILTLWQFIHTVSFNPNNNIEQIVHMTDCVGFVGNLEGVHSQYMNGDIEFYTWYSPMFMASQTINQDLFMRTFVQTPACHMFITEQMYIALAMCATELLDKTKPDMYTPDANPYFKLTFMQYDPFRLINDMWVAMCINEFLSDSALARLYESRFLE